jgi:hypothetical protein
MAKTTFRYIFVTEDGDALTTDDAELAGRAGEDGTTLVIDLVSRMATFDSAVTELKTADSNDWPDDADEDDEDEDEDEDEKA